MAMRIASFAEGAHKNRKGSVVDRSSRASDHSEGHSLPFLLHGLFLSSSTIIDEYL